MGGGRSYRIGELLLEALEPAMTLGPTPPPATCSSGTAGRGRLFDGDAWVALFADDAEYREDPFEPPLVGHNAIRAYLLEAAEAEDQVEFTIERHWVAGATVLAAWHASFVRRPSGRAGPAGRVPDARDRGRRAHRAVPGMVASPRVAGRDRVGRDRGASWRAMSRSTSSSDFDEQELRNALDQVRREVQQRYDFKGAHSRADAGQGGDRPPDRRRVPGQGVKDLIESKAVRRNLSLKIFDWGKIEPAGGNKVRQHIGLRRGLTDELARSSVKLIRDEFPKVKSQIQGDAIRVAGKSKDDLQQVIARLRELDEAVPLQFQNYR